MEKYSKYSCTIAPPDSTHCYTSILGIQEYIGYTKVYRGTLERY